jgi:diguanylate cyclase (GGDEF)-like protein
VWLFTAALAAAAAVLQVWVVEPMHASGRTSLLAIGVLVLGFVAAEVCVVHATVGRDAHSFAFAEIPFVVGLFYVQPSRVVLARVLGGALALVWHRRQTLVKLCFNVAQLGFGATAGVIVWRLITGGDAHQMTLAGVGALFAALVVATTSALAIAAVIALRGGSGGWRGLPIGLATSAANASFALIAIDVVHTDWHGLWAVAVAGCVLWLAHRANVALLRRHKAVERLQSFTQRIASSDLQLEVVVTEVLVGTRDLLEVASVRLELSELDGEHVQVWICDDDGVRRGATSATAMLTSGFSGGHRTAVDALSVLLQSADGAIGAISVFGRLGDVGGLHSSDVQLLEAIAGHAAVALHNGRLADRLRDQVQENHYQAMHDALTGLPNRTMFDAAAAEVLADNRQAAVLLLDLDRFKEVNDTLGHAAGDEVLRDIGSRLGAALADAACVARLGGDEFAVVLRDADAAQALQCARRIASALSVRLDISDVTLSLDASIGIALAPEHGHDIATLLRRADVAMYAAKDENAGATIYSADRDHHSTAQLSLVTELRESIAAGDLMLAYQPKTSLTASGDVLGVEALVRWIHPVRGVVLPDAFIPVAEQTGLIGPLTDWVLREALAQCRRWLDEGLDLGVAVNISPRTLHDAKFPARVAELLSHARVPAAKLTLEITEGALMGNPDGAIDMLWELRRAGIRLSVDDLGVGHSSLSYLKRLPVHEIKIDKSFVMGMADDDDDVAIVSAVVTMVQQLRMDVVAEGVEDERTWHRLAELGADAAQGYWMSRPLPAREVSDWVRQWAPPLSSADATSTVVPFGRAALGR